MMGSKFQRFDFAHLSAPLSHIAYYMVMIFLSVSLQIQMRLFLVHFINKLFIDVTCLIGIHFAIYILSFCSKNLFNWGPFYFIFFFKLYFPGFDFVFGRCSWPLRR